MKCPIIPLGDRVVLLPIDNEEQTYGNIIVPDTGQEKPEIGTVMAVGEGRVTNDGAIIQNQLKVGHKIMVPKFGAQVVVVDTVKNKTLSYHGDLEHAVKKISYLSLVSQVEDYTLTGFIESYKNIVEQLTLKFRI